MKAFVNVHVDAQKDEGKELTKRFHVRGYPTLLVVDAQGAEIDRIVGYLPPERFTPQIERILKGEDTLPVLRKHAAEHPEDTAGGLRLALKLAEADPAEGLALAERLAEKAKGGDHALEAETLAAVGRAAQAAGQAERARTAFEQIVTQFADTKSATEIDGHAVGAFLEAEPSRAIAFLEKAVKLAADKEQVRYLDGFATQLHLQAFGAGLKRQAEAAGDNPQVLNEVAWTCFEHRVNLKEAIGWARKAVEASKRDAAILDTLANLLFATGQTEEALKIEEEAVAGAKQPRLKAELAETLVKFSTSIAMRKAAGAGKAAAAGDEDGEGDEGDEADEGDEHGEGAKPAAKN